MRHTARHASPRRNPKRAFAYQVDRKGGAMLLAIAWVMISVAFSASATLGNTSSRYRPGMRINLEKNRIGDKEIAALVRSLREKSGFVELRFDAEGFLTLGDRALIMGGSQSAREMLIATVEMKGVIEIESHPRSMSVTFARLANQTVYENRRTGQMIEGCSLQIDFTDFSCLRGDKQALAAFDPGFVLLHELGHAVLGLRDSYDHSPGDCETQINQIRSELGLPERQTYLARVQVTNVPYGNGMVKMAELIFKNRERSLAGKGRGEFRLNWDALRVGPIVDQPSILATKARNTKPIATSVAGQ